MLLVSFKEVDIFVTILGDIPPDTDGLPLSIIHKWTPTSFSVIKSSDTFSLRKDGGPGQWREISCLLDIEETWAKFYLTG